ncbi:MULTISPECIES: DUF4913 domain-containing protein [unclassified Rhodococcus (in: high G+C Gram-positive bacteria)]|uniref:DUF4913 domain-containing protein n=1 Tax=unclassified Rhodococcus (in: high G+C Gram-positive bacteria) TaxID=192944 RepID=UPI0006FA0F33|nr:MULTISPECIES: DUF4913 domain-containing protein [unclassified Rhodococcus (in: high G+C Gram-positive bacteria)]KQU28413.1 hypothetical protein ASG69_10390 [Rhodococcus sp. Leaf225]KQU46519.1 hypothetical protein ASH03_07420 [Rhodococcus sp. Leaf258]
MSVDDAAAEAAPTEEAPERKYASMFEWFDRWYSPTIARRLSGTAGKSGRVFCPQWWRHDEVVRRLRDLWLAWEGAEASDNPGAPSAWWVHDADPHLRVLLDPENGPMYQCGKDKHTDTRPLRASLLPPPPGWFDGLD